MASQATDREIDLRTASAMYERIDLMTPTPQFRLLATLQLVAGLVTMPFAILAIDPGSNHAAEAVLSVLWLALAVFTAVAGPKIGNPAQNVSLWLSSTLLAAGTAVAIQPSVQILNGIGMMLTAVFAAYTLSRRQVTAFVAFSVAIYLASVIVSDVVVSIWIPLILVAMLVFNTAHVWNLVNRLRLTTLSDPLTGALNRNGLAIAAPDVLALADRAGNPTAVTLIDLDDFKKTNDERGHAAGDQLLVDTVQGWRSQLRRGDQVARLGGDEFVLLTPNCTVEQTQAVLARLRAVSPCEWTAGTVQWHRSQGDVFAAISEADVLMYAGKRSR